MIHTIEISTKTRSELIDITPQVEKVVGQSGIKDGICYIFIPHTTAGITINENYDPSVKADILSELNKIAPQGRHYSHTEGNADSHIKSTLVNNTTFLFIEQGSLAFGTWQGIFFCEFDGPRKRKVLIKIV